MWDENVLGTTSPTGTGQLTYGGQFVDQEADLPLALDPSGKASWDFQFTNLGKLLGNLGIGATSGLGQAIGGISSLLGGTSGSGQLGSFLGSAGLGLLLNRLGGSDTPAPVGYQGGIPEYTVSRQQLPYQTGQQNELLRMKQAAQDAMSTGATQEQVRDAAFRTYGISPSQFDQAMKTEGTYRRPGQGGITYFTPTRYTPTGRDLSSPSAGNVVEGAGTIGGGGVESLPTVRPASVPSTPRIPTLSASPSAAPSTVPRVPQGVPPIGSPERVAYEQRLASQMTPEEFRDLQASPYSVLSPSFNAALQANLAGKEELARRGMSSVFGSGLRGDTPQDVQNYLTAIQIERPMGGHLRSDNDLNALMSQYLDALDSGDVGNAFAARNRLRTLGVGPDVLNPALEIMRPGINDRAYYKYYDPSNPNAKGLPMDLEGVFAPGGGGNPWAIVAQQKEKYGLTDEQIAFGLGITPEEVKRSLPKPVGAAAGGAMPGGIAMLAKGRYIQGDGDGVSDSVPAQFVHSKRPAALSDGEFVFPARIVAEVGNGSNKAGAKKLYAFMDRVEAKARSAKRGKPSGADKELNRLA